MPGATGVAVAAVCIQIIQLGFGDSTLEARDLSLAFVAVAILSSLSMLVFATLRPDAGAALAARAPVKGEEAPTAASEGRAGGGFGGCLRMVV